MNDCYLRKFDMAFRLVYRFSNSPIDSFPASMHARDFWDLNKTTKSKIEKDTAMSVYSNGSQKSGWKKSMLENMWF